MHWLSSLLLYLSRAAKFVIGWMVNVRQASPGNRWRMIRIPLACIIILFGIIRYGYIFIPPHIATSFPGNKSEEAPLDSTIEILFDKGILHSRAEAAFSIQPAASGTFTWEGDQKLIFTPKENLKRATAYTVKFGGVVLSTFLSPLVGNKTIMFQTIGNPTIVIASPQTEALEDLTPITVIFDRPMIALTTATNSAIKQPAFTIDPVLEGAGRWLGTTAYQFRPSVRLKRATTYTVTVPGSLHSQDDGQLAKDYVWQFSSERPRIVDVSPKHEYQFTSPVASIAATFNQDINPSSIPERFIVRNQNNKQVSGRTAIAGKRTVGFYPDKPLTREERYTATLTSGVASIEGPNGMENEYTWSFNVAAKPAIVKTVPQDKETEVSEQYNVYVSFKTPMDENSFKDNIIISPKPSRDPSIYFSTYDNRLSIGTYLGRSTTYTITVSGAVKDQYGVPLGNAYTFQFKTAPYKPSITIYPSGTYFAAFNAEVIPRVITEVINANRVDYKLFKLSREDLLDLYRRRYTGQCKQDISCSNWQSYDTGKLTTVREWNETYESDFNTPVQVITKVSNPSGGQLTPGFYFLDARIPQGIHDNMVMVVTKSTLTVKRSNNQMLVWAVNQTTGSVVSGMNVELTDTSNTSYTKGTTNADGVFMKNVDLFNKNNLFVFGQKDDDTVVAAGAWNSGMSRYDFGLPSYYDANQYKEYRSKDAYKLFVTPDRPIYRPGQKVYFKGVIRKDNDASYEQVPSGEQIQATVQDARGRSVFDTEMPLTSFGSFAGELMLSNDANLGNYQITSTFRGTTYTQQFQVEEYRKPELAVSVKPSKDAYVSGEIATVVINASYYFGAPVVDAPVTWILQTQDFSFQWDTDRRFEFGDPESYWLRPWWYYGSDSYFSGKKVTEGKGRTNAKGDLEIALPLDIAKYKTSQKMIVEAVVNDINNQSIAASNEFTVHRGALYAGLHPASYSNQSGKEAKVEVVVVDLKGKEMPNIPVTVAFYKRTWETVREKNPDDGNFYYVSKPTDTLVTTARVISDATGRAVASFTPEEGGTFKVDGSVTDAQGHTNHSGSYLWVSGYGFSTARENHDRIVVMTDKREYVVGEQLSVFVATPYATDSAKTLLTAERGSVLDYKVVDASDTSNNFTLSIPPAYSPNVYISATLVRPGAEVKKPAEFKIGYTEIKVTDKKQHIDVRITTDKKRYHPKDTLKATIETNDVLGHPVPSELAVGLVDKAVWDLASVEIPDIYKTFYQPRNLEVQTAQLLTISMDRINANTNLGAKGGSGGGCFTGDTLILMKGGVEKKIKDIKVGDVVLTKENDMSDKLVEAPVTKTFTHVVDEYLILNGQLRVTPIHRLFVNNQWMTAGKIVRGDYLVNAGNQPVRVFSIEQVRGTFDVYNLEIANYRTYFAGNIYVHNQKGVNNTTRRDFPDTAYWNPHVITDQNGKAELTITLPDNLTTWRLAAIANSSDAAFGSKTAEVVVNRDVLIRPFTPRFLSIGDEAKLGAIVVNTSGEEQTITTAIESTGLEILDKKGQTITLDDGATAKLVWATRALNTTSAMIKLTVTDSDQKVQDAVEITLPVQSYSVPETVATAGQAADTAEETIVLPVDVDTTQGSGEITFSPSLGSPSFYALPYLFSYPYFSAEQITSRLLPAVFVHRILKAGAIDKTGPVDTKRTADAINDAIQRLNNEQHPDGGWGWWKELESNPFVSAYAFIGLSEAKKDQFAVADQTLIRAQQYLENELAQHSTSLSLNTQAYIIYALHDYSDKVNSYAANLYERRFELSIESRAYLAIALKTMPGMGDRAKRLMGELTSFAKKTATTTHWEEGKRDYYYMGSTVTATASVLEALSTFNSKNPLIPEVVRYLMSIRRDGHWQGTRDTAEVIKAIATQLLNKQDQQVNEQYRFEVNGKLLKESSFTKADILKLEEYVLSIKDLTIGGENKLRITKSGSGNLYYNINLRYYLPFTEIEPLEQGMVVIRELVDSKGNVLPANVMAEHTEAWMRIIVVAPEMRHYVVIEDVLPAGLESVNESLKNVSALSKNKPKTKGTTNQELYFAHKEYHDDRTTLFADTLYPGVYEIMYRVRATTPGRYHHPPAQAYQMYTPDVSGHSDGGWFEVRGEP